MTIPSPARKAIEYAETQLSVHGVYDGACSAAKLLDEAFTALATMRDAKRAAELVFSDREFELITDEHGRHPEMSVAAMERHLKLELPKDHGLQVSRQTVAALASQIEGVEFDIRQIETDIRIAVARMTELGGYLSYLAAIKSHKPEKPEIA